MNLVMVGAQAINLDLVTRILDRCAERADGAGPAAGPGQWIEVEFFNGGVARFTGPDAEALRRFVAENARLLDPGGPAGEFVGDGGGSLVAQPQRGEQGGA